MSSAIEQLAANINFSTFKVNTTKLETQLLTILDKILI